MASADELLQHTDDGIRTIELNRPPRHLLDPPLMSAMTTALRDADDDRDVRGIMLTGTGDVFCGGLDIDAIKAGGDPVEFATHMAQVLGLLPTLGTPVAAAVNGDALAGGAALVCACDFAVAVPDTRIGTIEVSVGLWPMVAQVPLIHRIGPRAAMENVGSGVPFTADRARQVGLVHDVVAAADLLPRVRGWLDQAARAGGATRIGRRAFYELAGLSYHDALEVSLTRFSELFE
jgi:enoyl-CoA hydratase/carnithine racemase